MPPAPLSRRVLVGAGAAAGLALVGGCSTGGNGTMPIYDASAGTISGDRWGGSDADWRLAVPHAGRPTSLVVGLHGKGGQAKSSFELGLADAAAALGLVFVSVSGGDGYWHRRRDGRDPARLVLDELIPLARKGSGLSTTSRIAFTGWSMGGYGSLLLANEVPREQLLGVATLSAALWTSPGATAAGAFDDAEDYAAYDIFASKRLLPGVPVSMACGASDPFITANKAYAARRPATRTTFDRGGHDGGYWKGHAGAAMDFLAAAV